MASFALQAEIRKLARQLNVSADRIGYLDRLDVATLRELRAQITAALFDADAHLFQRLAAASKMLPTAIAALVAERALGPLLCARVAGLLPPRKAVDIATRLHTDFLADVCLSLDPRHVRDLIAGMPVKRIVEVARVLAARDETITMASFVDVLPDTAMRAVIEALDDDRLLLRTGFYVESPAQLDAVIMMLPEARVRRLVLAALDDGEELWSEALTLINGLSDKPRRHMAGIAASLDDDHLARMLRSTQSQGQWAALLPVVATMDERHRERLAQLPALHDIDVLEAMIRAADEVDLWPALLPWVTMMPASLHLMAAQAADRLGPDAVARLNTALATLAPDNPNFRQKQPRKQRGRR